MLPDEIQLWIDVALAEGPAWIGAIIVLIALVRSFETLERAHQSVDSLVCFSGKLRDCLLGFYPLTDFKDIDGASIFSAR